MSYDGITTRAVVNQLQEFISGGKINKITQPDLNEIILHIYNNKENYKLLVSASPNCPAMHLSTLEKQNPKTPPDFCMLLRKHLTGGIIRMIEQVDLDRIINIHIETKNDMGDFCEKLLIVEIMGKHSNIILVDKENYKIIDSIKRVGFNISRIRQIYPGKKYELIKSDKKNLLSDVNLHQIIKNCENIKVSKFFYTFFTGMGPLINNELIYLSSIDENKSVKDLTETEIKTLQSNFSKLKDKILKNDFSPSLILGKNENKISAFYPFNIHHLGEFIPINDISFAIEKYYRQNITSDKLKQKTRELEKTVNKKLSREIKKLAILKEELLEAQNREVFKIYADVLSANSHLIQKGTKNFSGLNFYSENSDMITIPLDIKKSPWENAQMYYKKFSKLKVAEKLLSKEIPETEEEIRYLNQVTESLSLIKTVDEADEIKFELEETGILKRTSKNKMKSSPSKPYHFIYKNTFHIFVGKNNFQNDNLTLKFANKNDIFFHAKDIPGSHVILRYDEKISSDEINVCALLAAHFSKGKNEKYISVDYTEKKNVYKSKGGKPGMVYYNNFKTVNVKTVSNPLNMVEEVL